MLVCNTLLIWCLLYLNGTVLYVIELINIFLVNSLLMTLSSVYKIEFIVHAKMFTGNVYIDCCQRHQTLVVVPEALNIFSLLPMVYAVANEVEKVHQIVTYQNVSLT